MGKPAVTATAMLQCSFGLAPSTLSVIPIARVMIEGKPAAAITDAAPIMNIPPLGMCTSLANPQVLAATAAALGVLTPMPCIPVTGAWVGGAMTTLIGGKPGLTFGATCMCGFGGVIQIVNPGSVKTLEA